MRNALTEGLSAHLDSCIAVMDIQMSVFNCASQKKKYLGNKQLYTMKLSERTM